MTRLIVVDVSNFIFRAFYAIRSDLKAPDGTPVNAISGVFSMFLKLFANYKPTHILLARDSKDVSFRKELYSEYKANRQELPEDLIPQFALIDELIDKMGFPNLSLSGYEADDVIGSVVTQFKKNFDEIFIASSDKDLMQFVDEKVKMLDTMKEKVYGPEEVHEKMGVWPEQIVDYLSIVGDSSDNIPGMKGIGAKGAAQLLETYKTLEACIEHKSELKGKRLINAFDNHLEDAKLSKKLIKIITDLDLSYKHDELIFRIVATKELLDFLRNRLGFNRAIKRLEDIAEGDRQAAQSNDEASFAVLESKKGPERFEFELVKTETQAKKVLNQISQSKTVAIKIKYDHEKAVTANIESVCLSVDGQLSYYFPFGHYDEFEQKPIEANLPASLFKKVWESTYGNPDQLVISDQTKMNISFGFCQSLELKSRHFDLLQAHFVLDASAKHEVGYMAERFLDLQLTELDKKEVFSSLGLERAAEYVGDRSCATFLLFDRLKKELEVNNLLKILSEMDEPLLPILSRMENHGVGLNTPYLEDLEEEFTGQLLNLEKQVEKASGQSVNLRSPKQLSKLLFEDLGLPIIKKNKTGPSTDSFVLEELVAKGFEDVPGAILKFRELDKLLSTYVCVLPNLIQPKTGRIHTSFNLHVAATGRFSSDKPNLQNIPVRTENGRKIRKAFISRPGWILLSADYSQVELRILAHLSQDTTMIQAFKDGIDIHARTASEVLRIPLEEVHTSERSKAKAVNFGLMYGQSSFGLANTLKITRSEAKDYITMYFERFSRVKSFLDSLKEKCEQTGYAETIYGRKRFLPDIRSSNRTVKSMAERVAINSPIQGTAADIIKLAMLSIQKEIEDKALKSCMALQVHDELIFEVPENELKSMRELVVRNMEGAAQLSVPLKVDVGVGVNWFDLK